MRLIFDADWINNFGIESRANLFYYKEKFLIPFVVAIQYSETKSYFEYDYFQKAFISTF